MTAQPRPPLHAVPSIEETQDRMGILVVLKNAARAVFDQAASIPRGAIGWVVHHAQTLIAQATTRPVLSRAVNLARHASSAIRAVGLVPIAVAVASTPVVRQRLLSAAAWVGSRVGTVAGSLWGRAAGFLSRSPLGRVVTRAAVQAVATIRATTVNVLTHPGAVAVTRGVRQALAAARPVSVAVIGHRVAALIAPAGWMRVALQVAVIPAVLGALLNTSPALSTSRVGLEASAGTAVGDVTEDIERNHGLTPQPAAHVPAQGQESGVVNGAHPPVDVTASDVDTAVADEAAWVPMNRAERRAQQRADARAQRAHQHPQYAQAQH